MNTDMTIVDVLLTEILDRMNLLDSIDETKKAQYKEDLTPIIENRILSALLVSLTDEDREKLGILEDADAFQAEMLLPMLSDPDKQPIIEAELAKLVDELSTI